MIYNCTTCPKTFSSKRSLANHARYGCASIREEARFLECSNPRNNSKCKKVFRHSKTGLCKSCSAKESSVVSILRTGKTYEELFGEDKARSMVERATYNKKEWHKSNIGIYSKEQNPNYGKSPWMKGLSLDQIHGKEKAVKIKEAIGKAHSGINCPFYGQSGFGTKNSFVQFKIKQLGITEQEYEQLRGEWNLYKREVLRITREQPITLLEGHEKRGKTGKPGAYHLDHAISIKYGYLNNISPHLIGNIKNLRFISWEDNMSKGPKCDFNYKG